MKRILTYISVIVMFFLFLMCTDDTDLIQESIMISGDGTIEIFDGSPPIFIEPPLRRGEHIWYVTREMTYGKAGELLRSGTYLYERDGKTPETSFNMLYAFQYMDDGDTLYLEYANYGDEELEIYTTLERWKYYKVPNTRVVDENGNDFYHMNKNQYTCNCYWEYNRNDSIYIMWYE